ncbi:MAG: potassium channel protein [Myxococcales bacterium]|nr:potassium channel protein [Myxococcales bacterium]
MKPVARLAKQRMLKHPPAALRIAVLMLGILAYGTTGFLYFELPENPSLTWLDGAWYSLVTMSTVGYGDFFPKTPGGRLVVALPLMAFGVSLLGYVLSLVASALVQAKNKELHGMASHSLDAQLVIINFPSLSKVERVLDELTADPTFGGRDVVLIDEDLTEVPPELASRGVRFVRGNPTRDETLTRADIDHAEYVVVLAKQPGNPHSDDQNVAITLAIEARKHKVHSVVECVDYSAQELLKKAGCDAIVCTSRFDAHFLSNELLNPGVQEVVDELTTNLRGQQIYISTIERSEGIGFTKVAEHCKKHGHIAIGARIGGAKELNITDDRKLAKGDAVISIGAQRMPPL